MQVYTYKKDCKVFAPHCSCILRVFKTKQQFSILNSMYTKRFIKGPSLHEESRNSGCSSTPSLPFQTGFKGDEAKKTYDEIISLPSNELANGSNIILNPTVSDHPVRASCSKSKNTSSKVPKPSIGSLMRLCERNDYKQLSEIFKTADDVETDETDQFGWTLLMCASCAGALECVQYLLQIGADWSLADKKGLTAHSLARKHNFTKISDFIKNWEKRVENFGFQEDCESNSDSDLEPDDKRKSKDGESKRHEYYCESCEVNFTNRKLHSKSIAHLVSASKYLTSKTHFGIPESNIGFQLMVRTGWDTQSGLGPEGKGQKFPIKTVLKRNRKGLGNELDRKAARITHFASFDSAAVEVKPEERLENRRTLQKKEDIKNRRKERRKEISYRRELGSI